MATLSINFTPADGIASYRVCYAPVGSIDPPTCINVAGSPVDITEGITCGVRYDIAVASVCPPGAPSTHSLDVTMETLVLECKETPKTINVLGANGYMEPCVGGTIDDYMGATVLLDAPVTVDTVFNVVVRWTNLGTNCDFPYEQSFAIEVLAGQSSSNFIACTYGVYISSGASICSAYVNGHNNEVDTIVIL